MTTEAQPTLAEFIDNWEETSEGNRKAFLRLKAHLAAKDGAVLTFIPRKGVTYSLRGTHPRQTDKSLFVMVDVIEDAPRWISVCFYGEMITDPDELGDFVPEGLLGEDAICFDIEEWDDAQIGYIESRIDEAFDAASNG
ncbi:MULTISPECIES: hypothetical protein [Desulfococcus]|jgi:hypothetical protein|uniref:YdhG-like domain-containing protein n=1 Tax=Desulfococcus multivorans DSM 2059 TaxID=1121405 RepID=S7U0E0_DESML|nr:hypothetical protein [Desulfococcus multivorans]AOY57003.1 conserved uncharacterized protein [Desulfococcus multivorans]AQU99520.1 hypothetical protein B2D07_01135 [Desulfococcus multivorans]EPR42891.1 hypothetical protein dsmv_1474 [Desulfococcus multivorans DSM 2059]MDX9818648.1 hypothetical protein [Desulfococcus multivorans]SJZ89897.1 hypothetical protein SAMN02745446_02020 [Desulfococcus multivorans DSM 2059]